MGDIDIKQVDTHIFTNYNLGKDQHATRKNNMVLDGQTRFGSFLRQSPRDFIRSFPAVTISCEFFLGVRLQCRPMTSRVHGFINSFDSSFLVSTIC